MFVSLSTFFPPLILSASVVVANAVYLQTLHPGNLDSELGRNLSAWQYLMAKCLLYPPLYGAYTELFAGLAPEGAVLKESEWVLPWGRVVKLRKDFYSDEGKENAKAFWEWSEKQVERFT